MSQGNNVSRAFQAHTRSIFSGCGVRVTTMLIFESEAILILALYVFDEYGVSRG